MSKSPLRIEESLRERIGGGGKCLVPYITGGFEGYIEAIYAAAEAGADAIEIGIPFSDPVMDGPTIQKANDIVLAQKISPFDILQDIRDLEIEIPLAVMTYYNIVYRFGLERFANALYESGISGAILPDLPLNEAESWLDAASENGTEAILLAAPTTTDKRLEALCSQSKGFVYAVGLLGITFSLISGTFVMASKIFGLIAVPGYTAIVLLIMFFGSLNIFAPSLFFFI